MEQNRDPQRELLQMLLTEKIVRDQSRRTLLRSELAQLAGVTFRSEQFFLLLIDVVDCFPLATGKPSLARSGAELDRAILTTAADTLSETFHSIPFISNNDYFLLVNVNPPLEENAAAREGCLTRLVSLCHAAAASCLQRYHIKVRIFVSRWIPSLDELGRHFSYFRLSSARDDPAGFEQDVVTAAEVAHGTADTGQATRNRICACEQKIFSCALEKDFPGLRNAFFKLIDLESGIYPRTLSMNDRSASRIECLFGLLGIPYFSDQYPYLQVNTCLESIRGSISPEELKENIADILEDFRAVCFPATRSIEVRVDEIAEYIQSHYTDPELSADQLSTRFGISISYLSTVFKEKMGVRLLDYIHQCRLSHAKRLLSEQNQTVEAVAAATGYHSALTLTRAFKRYNGITPGQFRMKRIFSSDEPSIF